MLPDVGPVELILVLVIVAMLFGLGKLPEVFGAVGKGIREFRREVESPEPPAQSTKPIQPAEPTQPTQPTEEKHT